MRIVRILAIVLAALILTGCGLTIPTDPDGTLDTVHTEGVLRVGASVRPGWVETGDGREASGREPDLVRGFAEHLGVDVEWTLAGEEHLVGLLEHGELDLAVGGITEDNPWVSKVGLTRPYAEATVDGTTEKHVMMVPMGENAFQSELERWLDEHGGSP